MALITSNASKRSSRIANSVNPDQTAPRTDQIAFLGAVWSGSALFAQTYLSKNLGDLIEWLSCAFNSLSILKTLLYPGFHDIKIFGGK